jgi:hypothetical protein
MGRKEEEMELLYWTSGKALSLPSNGILVKSLNFPEPQFPY